MTNTTVSLARRAVVTAVAALTFGAFAAPAFASAAPAPAVAKKMTVKKHKKAKKHMTATSTPKSIVPTTVKK